VKKKKNNYFEKKSKMQKSKEFEIKKARIVKRRNK